MSVQNPPPSVPSSDQSFPPQKPGALPASQPKDNEVGTVGISKLRQPSQPQATSIEKPIILGGNLPGAEDVAAVAEPVIGTNTAAVQEEPLLGEPPPLLSSMQQDVVSIPLPALGNVDPLADLSLITTAGAIIEQANILIRNASAILENYPDNLTFQALEAKVQELNEIIAQLVALEEKWQTARGSQPSTPTIERLNKEVSTIKAAVENIQDRVPSYLNGLSHSFGTHVKFELLGVNRDVREMMNWLPTQKEYTPILRGVQTLLQHREELRHLIEGWEQLKSMVTTPSMIELDEQIGLIRSKIKTPDEITVEIEKYETILKDFAFFRVAKDYKLDGNDILLLAKIPNEKWIAYEQWLKHPEDEATSKQLTDDFLDALKQGLDLSRYEDAAGFASDRRTLSYILRQITTENARKAAGEGRGPMDQVD